MARNVYFNNGAKNEQFLFEDLTIEALKIYGQDTYYLPRTVVTKDLILGEDVESQFDDAYMIEMYIEDIEGFGGEGNLMAKFGLEIRDEATFVVARRTWDKLVGVWNNGIESNRPNEGDLIYLPLSKSMFEISHVEHEQPFYQVNNLPVYKLQCRLFEHSDEDFDTGIDVIDAIEANFSTVVTLHANNFTGSLKTGNRMYQVVSSDETGPLSWVSGKVVANTAIEGLINEIQLTDIEIHGADNVLEFYVSADNLLVDNISSPTVTCRITEVFDIESDEDKAFSNDSLAQNWAIEDEADSILDFSESNPFGDPT